jgi:hypothetical protein
MLKGKLAVLSLGAAALLCLQVAGVDTVNSGIVDPCSSTASSPGTYPADPTDVHFACPGGDVIEGLGFLGLTISVTVKDNTGAPIVGMPNTDIWAKGCNDGLVLCGGSGAISASAATDALGMTTITGDMAVGGCDTGLNVVIQGIVVGGTGCPAICLGIAVRSPDFTSPGAGLPNGIVDLLDFATSVPVVKGFSPKAYQSPPKAYTACYDLAFPWGTITLGDFSKFGLHYLGLHKC